MSSKKYTTLTVQEKIKLSAVDSGKKVKDVVVIFGIGYSTACDIVKNKDKILQLSQNSNVIKRQRKQKYENVNNATARWFEQMRAQNVPISGDVLKKKALKFADDLGVTSFKASNGWIDKFKSRNNIVHLKLAGEASSVNMATVENFRACLPSLLAEYSPSDIYNADETGLFYKMLPDKTLHYKRERCHGGKMSKERITVLPICNMTGNICRYVLE